MNSKQILAVEVIENKIFLIRGKRVMIDSDIAKLYGVTTKKLNQQVKRNRERFPDDFMIQLNLLEKLEVVTNCDHLKNLKYSPNLPFAFTEHGVIMLAAVLNSSRAVETSVLVVRAFIRLREILAAHKELAEKMKQLESKIEKHDKQIIAIFEAINQLLAPPMVPKKKMGFEVRERRVSYKSR